MANLKRPRVRKYDVRSYKAFRNDAEWTELKSSVHNLAYRAMSHKPSPVNATDLLFMFVPYDLRETALNIPKHFDSTVNRSCIEHKFNNPTSQGKVSITFYPKWNKIPKEKQFAIPRSPQQFVGDENDMEKINQWIRWRLERGREWSLVMGVLEELDKLMPTEHHVRFYFPSLVAIADQSPFTKPLAEDIRSPKVLKEIPSIPHELAVAIKQAEGTIAKALMLPEKRMVDNDEVTVTMERNYTPAFPAPWRSDYCLPRI